MPPGESLEALAEEASEASPEGASQASPETETVPENSDAPQNAKTQPHSPASFQALTGKPAPRADTPAPKLAHLVGRSSEPPVQVDNKEGKMAALVPKTPNSKR